MRRYWVFVPICLIGIVLSIAAFNRYRVESHKMMVRKKLADQSIQKSVAVAKMLGIIVPRGPDTSSMESNMAIYKASRKEDEKMGLILDYVSHPNVKPDPMQGMTGTGTVAELTPAQFKKLQNMLAAPVRQITIASGLVSSNSVPNTSKKYLLIIHHYPSLADSRTAAKILQLDAVVAIRANQPVEFSSDLLAIVRLTGQVESKNSIISFLVGYAFQAIAMSADAQALYKYPGNTAWASVVLENLKAWKEPAFLANAPQSWHQLDSVFTTDPNPTGKDYEVAFGNKDKKLDAVARSLVYPANLATLQAICFKYELLQDQANRFQYFQPQVWRAKFVKADSYLAKQGMTGRIVANMVFDQHTSASVCFKLRLITGMLAAFAEASLAKGTTGSWPSKLVFPKPILVPQSKPIPNVASAIPISTMSPIDPFTGSPIELKKTANGWDWVGQISQKTEPIPIAPVSETKPFCKPGMNALVIELINGKVKFLNIVRARG